MGWGGPLAYGMPEPSDSSPKVKRISYNWEPVPRGAAHSLSTLFFYCVNVERLTSISILVTAVKKSEDRHHRI